MFGVAGIFQQLAVLHLIAQGRATAHPHTLHPAGAHLVADAFGRHLPFEFGE